MMEGKEMEELASMGQALNEIDRQFIDPDSITMGQLTELSNKHSLTIIQVMALVSLVRWNRMFRKFSEMGGGVPGPLPSEIPPLIFPSPMVPDLQERDEIVDLHEPKEDRKPRIEFL